MSLISSFVVLPADRSDHWVYPTAQSRKCALCLAICSVFLWEKICGQKSSQIKCCHLSFSVVASYLGESAAWDEGRSGNKR